MPHSDTTWALFLPHAAQVPAHGGGTWRMTIEPRADFEGFAWRVEHSSGSRGLRTGSVSNLHFAKAHAELAVAGLEAEALASIGAGKGTEGHDPNHA